jgi:ribosome-associated translation inhibitor RaiA
MTNELRVEWHGLAVSADEEARLRAKLRGLERRVRQEPAPAAIVTITQHPAQRRFDVSFRLELGPLGPTLISHNWAETVDLAVERAVDDVERELERHLAKQRGEPSFGVPSRRRPPDEQP